MQCARNSHKNVKKRKKKNKPSFRCIEYLMNNLKREFRDDGILPLLIFNIYLLSTRNI